MRKVDYIRRMPGISDFNTLVDAINSIIDKLNSKIEIENVVIEREIKDFKFFKDEEIILPYESTYTLSSVEDANKVFDKYVLTYKEMNKINELILYGKVVSLIIKATELVTEKEQKQEMMFEKVEAIQEEELLKKAVKKRGRPKKEKSGETTPKKKKTSWE